MFSSLWILSRSSAEVLHNFWQLLWQMATDAEENLPKETELAEKNNSVSSLDEDNRYPVTVTDDGSLGFFLEQTDASLEDLQQVFKEKAAVLTAVWSMISHPIFLTVPCFQGCCQPHLTGVAWCTVLYCFEPLLECLIKSSVLQGKREMPSLALEVRLAGDQ